MLRRPIESTQYTSEQFQTLLADSGIVCSMSKHGDCWDNAAMESFFSTLKAERLSRRIHRSRDECRAEVFDYIKRFYNPRRQHSTLGYVSPCSLRQRLVRLNNLSEGMEQAQIAWTDHGIGIAQSSGDKALRYGAKSTK